MEDLGSRNGTWLAGARIDGVLPVGTGLDLKLGGQVPCRIEPRLEGGVRITLPGRVIMASLGPFRIQDLELQADTSGVVQLLSHGASPILNGLRADDTVDLAFGDKVQQSREGPILVEVVAP